MNILSDSEDELSDNELDFNNDHFDYSGYLNERGGELHSLTQQNNFELNNSLDQLQKLYKNSISSILKLYEGSNSTYKSDHWGFYSNAVENLSEMFRYSKRTQQILSNSSYNEGKSKFQYEYLKNIPQRNWNRGISMSYITNSLCKNPEELAQYLSSTSNQPNPLKRKRTSRHNKQRRRHTKNLPRINNQRNKQRTVQNRLDCPGTQTPLHNQQLHHHHQAQQLSRSFYDNDSYSPSSHSTRGSFTSSDDSDLETRVDREVKLRRCDSNSWRI